MASYEDTQRRIGGAPGAVRRRSTIIAAPVLEPDKRETWVIESIRAPDVGPHVFLDVIDAQGIAHRLVLPPKVVQAIYAYREGLAKAIRQQTGRNNITRLHKPKVAAE